MILYIRNENGEYKDWYKKFDTYHEIGWRTEAKNNLSISSWNYYINRNMAGICTYSYYKDTFDFPNDEDALAFLIKWS